MPRTELGPKKTRRQTQLRHKAHWRGNGCHLLGGRGWLRRRPDSACYRAGVLGKATRGQVPCLRAHCKVTQSVVGEAAPGPVLCEQHPLWSHQRRFWGSCWMLWAPLQLQKLGSSTAFQERSRVMEKCAPAGVWPARHTRTWRRNPFVLQHPLWWQHSMLYQLAQETYSQILSPVLQSSRQKRTYFELRSSKSIIVTLGFLKYAFNML